MNAISPPKPSSVATPRWLALLAVLALFAPGARAADELKPANSYAVIVGVLKWKNPRITTFSPRHRKDQELRDLLVKRGVPAGNIKLLLDDQATLANMRSAVDEIAGKA